MNWKYTGNSRPDFAVKPKKGQESVWDYPRPPIIKEEKRHVRITFNGHTVANTKSALRVLETASPPGIYIPPDDIEHQFLISATSSSICEWKGRAFYWSIKCGEAWARNAAWSYPYPLKGFTRIANYLSFYPAMLECWIGDVKVKPQPGSFYGGWITPDVTGPFKGAPGTEDW